MAIPTNTPVQIAMAKLYESNFRHFGRGLAQHVGGVVLRDDDVEVYAAPFQTVFSAYLPPRWPTKQCAGKLRSALRLGQQTGRGLDVIVGPSANAIELRERLLGYGIKCAYWVPFMHCDLSKPIGKPARIRHLSIELIDDLGLFDKWEHPYIGPMTTDKRRAERDYHQTLCTAGRARQLVAWVDGQLVGVALVSDYRSSAGVYDVAVLKPHRGRGIGTAVMIAALRQAREMGAACAVLSATTRAVPLYGRVGFEDAGHYGSYFIGRDRLRGLL